MNVPHILPSELVRAARTLRDTERGREVARALSSFFKAGRGDPRGLDSAGRNAVLTALLASFQDFGGSAAGLIEGASVGSDWEFNQLVEDFETEQNRFALQQAAKKKKPGKKA